MTQAEPKTAADVAALVKELNATFPGIRARPKPYEKSRPGAIGVCVSGSTLLPDELPIFTENPGDALEYDGTLHTAFEAWCEARGWYVEVYDSEHLYIEPLFNVFSMADSRASKGPELGPMYFGEAAFGGLCECPF